MELRGTKMKILKIKVKGLQLFPNDLDIDFSVQQRVNNENSEMLSKISPKIFQNNALAFTGINASGKTTTLKVISFVIQMLNNESINKIQCNEILNGLSEKEKIIFETYFCIHSKTVHKLVTTIKKDQKYTDRENDYVIEDEKVWSKDVKSVLTKKSLFNFEDVEPMKIRKGDEIYLPDDVSIVIALNKEKNSRIYFEDLTEWTNVNIIRFVGRLPQELIAFLDPSIEYLNFLVTKETKKMEFKLKFKHKEEIILNSPSELHKYLSSGTIKGINVFIKMMRVLKNGGYLIIDELENHFNKEIALTLVRFFMNHHVNPKGATLVFSTHYPEILDEFERNDSIYIVRNCVGINVDNLSKLLTRNDIKKSEIYQSDYLRGTAPVYEDYIGFKKSIVEYVNKEEKEWE